jgi:hypothetical protein
VPLAVAGPIDFIFEIQFFDQINRCGMGRDPSDDAEKLALGGIAILLVETAILCNFRPLQMHPDCGTIFVVGADVDLRRRNQH